MKETGKEGITATPRDDDTFLNVEKGCLFLLTAARRTEELIEARNPKWRMGWGTGIHPWAFRKLAEAGFSDLECFGYDEPAIYSHEGWRGRIRASAGVAATLSESEVVKFDQALKQLLADEFPADPLSVHHRVFVITAVA